MPTAAECRLSSARFVSLMVTASAPYKIVAHLSLRFTLYSMSDVKHFTVAPSRDKMGYV